MAIFGNKDKNGNFTINFFSVENTPLRQGLVYGISATLLEDAIEFKQRMGKGQSIYLQYSKITRMQLVKEEEITEKDKSVIGRALVGDLLLGPLGAMIGAIDATKGTKKTKKQKEYLVFNYISNEAEQALPVEIVGATMGLNKFMTQLENKCPNLVKPNINNEQKENNITSKYL